MILFDPHSIRSDFPQLSTSGLLYFDSAATSLKPRSMIDTITRFYEAEYATVHRALYPLSIRATDRYEEVRQKVARRIGAERADEIVFTRNATAGINLVAQSLGKSLGRGDEIVTTEMEHHSNLIPWQMLAKERGVTLKVAPMTMAAEVDLNALARLITERTRLVTIAHVANASGTIHPIREIAALCRAKGALLLVDAAQSVAHMPIDVKELGADFLVFSGHKAFGPTGIGVLYGRKELLDEMPPIYGGGDMAERVDLYDTTYQKSPLKFEAGTPPIASVIGMGAALDYLETIGLEVIEKHEQNLLKKATCTLQEIEGVQILGSPKKRGGILSFVVPGAHHLDIGTLLGLEGIAIRTGHHCAQPFHRHLGLEGSCRISFSPFNTVEEIDRLGQALAKMVPLLIK